ncbi:MAG TPA: site-2 protease family protein [Kiritimatiellia bacterium]|nr:site-2 protease family protein [Kiritimatiellia bacterium]
MIRGIPLIVHWSFLLILGWSGYQGYGIGGWRGGLFTITLTLLLFVCVVLHELGHALMARRYGILTRSITLLPIGGVAALDRIPRRPIQELLIAVAGPLVNVLIMAALYPLTGWPADFFVFRGLWGVGLMLELLFYVNLVMVVFNLIPAFPMDGGRIVRSLLALVVSYERATAIASVLGQVLALGMVAAGFYWNPFLILIGIMIFFGARKENQMVQRRSTLIVVDSGSDRRFIDIG